MDLDAKFPAKLEPLFKSAPYKIIRGGRGGGKSWGVARALLILGLQRKLRILCARETQRSIRDSVHRLLVDQIGALGLSAYFDIKQVQITGVNGTEFTFAGLSDQTAASIKSFEGADICWVEEGHVVTDLSWSILLPTLFRSQEKGKCECWVTFNPELDTDATWKRLIENSPPGAVKIEMNWQDNPWFPPDLNDLRLHDARTLPKYEYDWIWEGKCKPAVSGAIYADQVAELFSSSRIDHFPHDPFLPVYAVFDLGWNDSTAILIVQRHLSQLRVIDYIEDDHKPLDWYSAQLRQRPYNVQELFLPHDGAHDHLTGRSAQRSFEDLNWRVTVLPNESVEEGIRAVRMAFPTLYFNKSACTRLIECLKRYRRIIPATTGEPSKPAHDEFSHGADALRYTVLAAPQMGSMADGGGLKLPPLKYNWKPTYV